MPEQARQKKMPNLGEAYERDTLVEGHDIGCVWRLIYPLRTRCAAVDAFVVLIGLGYR